MSTKTKALDFLAKNPNIQSYVSKNGTKFERCLPGTIPQLYGEVASKRIFPLSKNNIQKVDYFDKSGKVLCSSESNARISVNTIFKPEGKNIIIEDKKNNDIVIGIFNKCNELLSVFDASRFAGKIDPEKTFKIMDCLAKLHLK